MQRAIIAVGCEDKISSALAKRTSNLYASHNADQEKRLGTTYQHQPLQPNSEPKKLHPILQQLLLPPPTRPLHHRKRGLEPRSPMQHLESGNTGNKNATLRFPVRAEARGDDFQDPGRDREGVEKQALVFARDAPVQFHGEEQVDVGPDFVVRVSTLGVVQMVGY